MSISIDELQVETQQPAPAASGGESGGASKPKRELKTEMELLRERERRLQAD